MHRPPGRLDVESDWLIKQVKEELAKDDDHQPHGSVPIEHQHLFRIPTSLDGTDLPFWSKDELDNDRTLASYNILNNSTLQLIVRSRQKKNGERLTTVLPELSVDVVLNEGYAVKLDYVYLVPSRQTKDILYADNQCRICNFDMRPAYRECITHMFLYHRELFGEMLEKDAGRFKIPWGQDDLDKEFVKQMNKKRIEYLKEDEEQFYSDREEQRQKKQQRGPDQRRWTSTRSITTTNSRPIRIHTPTTALVPDATHSNSNTDHLPAVVQPPAPSAQKALHM